MSEDPFQGEEWNTYARRVLDELVPKLDESAVTISFVPIGATDVKFAVELGMSIMLDKPIILAVTPGTPIPAHLARVADDIIEVDLRDPEASSKAVQRAITRMFGEGKGVMNPASKKRQVMLVALAKYGVPEPTP